MRRCTCKKVERKRECRYHKAKHAEAQKRYRERENSRKFEW